jgi:formate dehydrogenase major subunit
VVHVTIEGIVQDAQPDELLIDLINRVGGSVPQVCYHPQLGPVQTCDTSVVEENGRLIRAGTTPVADRMTVSTKSAKAAAAQAPAMDSRLDVPLVYH